ncbi:MAG: hypothetical protein ABSD75_26015 [Terriglobales bacterium]|jgi:hypothetical protein
MLPPLTNSIWEKLVKGEREMKSSNIAVNLLLFNSRLRYKRDPSPSNLNLLILHAYEVFKKQEVILDEAEFEQLRH